MSEPQLLAQRRQIARAGGAPHAAAEQDQAVPDRVARGQLAALGEGPEIPEADAAPFEMVLDQAQILGRGVLNDGDELHSVLSFDAITGTGRARPRLTPPMRSRLPRPCGNRPAPP